ncbi:hypothetical protein AaE_015700 [Aphanomyces astaci]|uniref:Uncharacterized protein n=1 Tax=Aphanomyces astaci TaxID=112090 RepID=A0A6A4YV75_APHAT|nr:hypothetical protein AaE_015700 [Aphanomyces astaci]
MTTSSTWWAIPVTVASVVALAYALVQLTVEPESVQKKRHAMHVLSEVQNISDTVVAKLDVLEVDVHHLLDSAKADSPNDVPLNSYYHFDSTGKKLKSKWDSYDVDAELDKVDDDTSSPRRPTSSPDQLRRKVGELEHEFEAILAYLDTVRGDEEVRIVRKQLVGAINDTYLVTLDRLKGQLA